MRILINDYEETKEQYLKIFSSCGYESNSLLFVHSFDSCKDFIIKHLEGRKLAIDLIVTNDSAYTDNDILKASELCFFKNCLSTSYSKGDFRISSIPILLYSKNDDKSTNFNSSFNSIVKKNEFGKHSEFIKECERLIKNWRKQLNTDLEVLRIKIKDLPNFRNTILYKNYYSRKISNNAAHYFTNETKLLSFEFIKCPKALNYDWLLLSDKLIEEAIMKYIDTYKNHIKYDRKNGERAVLHQFFKNNRTVLLRDTYSDMKYELNLNELNSKDSEECDFILKTEYPEFLNTTFFEVKKEDVTFYVKKTAKRPQISSEFLSHLNQVWGYKQFAQNPINKVELHSKLEYQTDNFDFVLLAGRLEEKEEMKNLFDPDLKRMFEGIKVITYEELEDVNVNYLEKFSRLKI